MIKLQEYVDFGYPGGPKIDKLAKEGEANIDLPLTHFDNLDFSFSGIKTAIINLNHKLPDLNKADLCASFESSVAKMIISNVKKALINLNENKIVLAGGVSKSPYIRESFDKLAEEMNITVYYPEMIAASGYYDFLKGNFASLDLNAVPNLKI